MHPIADHFEKRIRQQESNAAWKNAFPKPVPPLPTGLSSPLQRALDKKNNSASQPGVSYSGNTQQSPDSLISFTGLGGRGGWLKFFKKREETWDGCEYRASWLALMAVSITQLSNRLFLEFRFYNPHTVILLLLLPKHTLLAASPKICIRQCWVRQAELENSQSQVTPNAPPRAPGKPSNKDGR